MNRFQILLSVLLSAFLTSEGRASIVWRLIRGDVSVSIALVSGKYNVTITSTNGGGEVHFWSTTNGSDTIRYIRNTASGSSGVAIRVIPNPNNQYLVKTVEEISEQSSSPLQVAYCEVTTDIGSVNAWSIGELNAGANITGWIRANNSQGNSNISFVRAAGNIAGPIFAIAGQILEVTAEGSIGTLVAPASITAKVSIRLVKADEVHAQILVTGTTGDEGGFGRLEATAGDATGSLSCFKLVSLSGNRDIVVAGDLEMDVTVADHIVTNILINGSLNGDIVVEDDDRLEGQVIINAANGLGAWNGSVTVNGTTLSPKANYTQTSASIGGGAVGLAPFNFHATNCVPADNATVTSEPGTVTLSHYGPVEKNGQTSVAEIKIIRHPLIHFCAQCDETVTGHFTWEYAANGRDIVITPSQGYAFEDGYEYHITPVITGETVLRCQGVSGNPVVQSYDYNFKVDVP